MCYSAQIRSNYMTFTRMFGATISLKEFADLFFRRAESKSRIPKALEAEFDNPSTPEEAEIKSTIDAYRAERQMTLEQELFAQKHRLVEAERKLQTKPTKDALDSQRIATDKISKAQLDLSDLKRKDLLDRDHRIFPGWYAPVMVVQGGQKVVMPMRYLCRPEGAHPSFDVKFSGCYNARRDNLEKFWKKQFGYTHGVIALSGFYENVKRHDMEHRPLRPDEAAENVILKFEPNTHQDLLVACVWSLWKGADGEELLSFAVITDDPPAEVAAAGHDRCPIPIKRENVDAWLNPDAANLHLMQDILEDKERPHYDHRVLEKLAA
jgi:putative SOS response-associated peptidase YedK